MYLFNLICHQLPSKTLSLNGQFMPLCSRCTGIYTGLLIALVFQTISGRKKHGFPPISISLASILFILSMAIQVVGSHFASWLEDNHVRFVTGLLCGSSVGIILFPLFNYFFFKETLDKPVIRSWTQYFSLVTLLVIVFVIHFSKNLFVFHFLSYTSVIGVIVTYFMVNIFLSTLILAWKRRKKTFKTVFGLVLLVICLFSIEVLLLKYISKSDHNEKNMGGLEDETK